MANLQTINKISACVEYARYSIVQRQDQKLRPGYLALIAFWASGVSGQFVILKM